MGNSTFGGSGSGRSADDSSYGFFSGKGGGDGGSSSFGGPSTFGGAPPASAPAPTGPAFGAPSGPAFGAPTYGPGTPSGSGAFGAPTSAVSSGGSTGRSTRTKVGAALLGLFVLGSAFSGYRYLQHHRAITIPTSLGGLPKSSDARYTSILDLAKKSVQDKNPDFNLDAAVYAGPKAAAFLLVGRGDVNVGEELSAIDGATQQVGANTCVVETDKSAVACLRTGGQLTVIVFTGYVKGDLTQASKMVDEAWAQQ